MRLANTSIDRRMVVWAALLMTYLQAVNISLPNAALPYLQGALGMTDDEVGWVFTAYIAASAVSMPLTRCLSEAFGRKALLLASLALFAVALVLDAQATTPLQFVAARILQGAASGPQGPLAIAILLEETPPEHHPRISLISTVTLLFGIFSGPALGGWISEYHGWQAMFYLGLPATALIFLPMARLLAEKKPEHIQPFDVFGYCAFFLGMTGLQMFLDRGERIEWLASVEGRLEAAAALLGFYFFFVHILTSPRHFLNKALFRDRNFILSTIMFFAFGFVLLPTLALTSPMLEELLGYPVDTTGMMTIPRGAAIIGTFVLTSLYAKRIDARLLILVAIGIVTYGNWTMLGYSPLMDWRYVVLAGVQQGAGLGILMPALNRAAFSTLDPAFRPEGTALFNLARLYGSTIGIAIVQVYFFNNTQMMHLALAKNLTPHHAIGKIAGLFSGKGLVTLNEMVTGQAATVAVIDQFKLILIVLLTVSPLTLLLRKPRPNA